MMEKWEPRTLMFDLSEYNCYLFLPTMMMDYLHDSPPRVYVAMKARYNRMVGMFVAGELTLGGTWLGRPKINEGIIEAGYYTKELDDVELPKDVTDELENLIIELEPIFGPLYEENRCLAVS